MQKICAIAASAALFLTPALAPAWAQEPPLAPLPPGKPAGIKHAQNDDMRTTIELIGLGAAAVGIALLIGGNGLGNSSGSSTLPTTPVAATGQ